MRKHPAPESHSGLGMSHTPLGQAWSQGQTLAHGWKVISAELEEHIECPELATVAMQA